MNKFGQFQLNDNVIDKESGEHGIVREVNPRIDGLPSEVSKMIYRVEIINPLDTPTVRMYVTDELMLDAPDDGLQYALDVAICALQEIFEAAGRDGAVFYETHAYKAIDTIAIILTADEKKHFDVVNEAQERVESR